MRINVIGAGRVGEALMRLMRALPQTRIGDVLSTRVETAQAVVDRVGAGRAVAALSDMRAAELWLLTVPDDRIETVAADLADARRPQAEQPAAAVHCSGFLSSEALAPLRGLGWGLASCHPVRSFADPETSARQFPGTYCGVEGDAATVALMTDLVAAIGGRPFTVSTEKKALYHAAAVFSNNFTVVLQAIALDAWNAAEVDPDVARGLCSGLLGNTAENVARLGPAGALTGPAARGDTAVVNRQADIVAAWEPDAALIYRLLSDAAGRLKRSGSAFSDQSPGAAES